MTFQIYVAQKKLLFHYQKAIDEYQKRLSAYCNIVLHTGARPPKADTLTNQAVFLITQGPSTLTSVNLAELVQEITCSGISSLSFFIGYDPQEFQNLPATTLSISNLDFSSDLTAMVLFEQIYRSFRIIHHQPYHK